MKLRIALLTIFIFATPLAALAAEPAWWTKQKSKCGLSSGLAYNTWVSQGSPCNSGGAGSSGGSIGTIIGTEAGKALGKALFGDPEEDARRKAQEQIRAEEQRRAAEEADRKKEEQKNRLLGGMMGIDNSAPLGLMGVESSSELSLMTGDQAAPTSSWDQYKDWEKYKRDVLAYQGVQTESNPGNRENQNWCKGHIPLSTSANRGHWEARCNPDGHVKAVNRVTTSAARTESGFARAVTNAAPVKEQVSAPSSRAGEAKAAAKADIDATTAMPGKLVAIQKSSETLSTAAPVTAAVTLKVPAAALTGSDEEVSSAARGGFDTTAPMPGKAGTIPQVLATSPALPATPVVAAKAEARSSIPVAQKEAPPPVNRQLTTGKLAVSPPKTVQEQSSPSRQTIVAGKQVKALSCAIEEIRGLTRGMGEERAYLRAGLKSFVNTLRVELNKPCSGQSETINIQALSLSSLTEGAKEKEGDLQGSVLVTRDEKNCEVHLDVQHVSASRSSGQSYSEGQSIIHLDNTGAIIAAETPLGVEKCLSRLAIKEY